MAIVLSSLLVIASVFGGFPVRSEASASENFNEKAAQAVAILEGSFSAVPDNPYGAGWWNAANILETTLDYMQRSGSRVYMPVIEKAFKESKEAHSKNFINEYYDDEGWWAITWIKAYDLTGKAQYLDMAKTIFSDMTSGWDDTAGGGIWWNKDRGYKNAIANELFLEVAARLHNRTPGDVTYLDWAKKEWQWFKDSGMINDKNLVNDGLKLNPITGRYENNGGIVWTYNQGVILGGLVALHEATNDPAVLIEAQKIADAVIGSSSLNVKGVLTEPCESFAQGCDGDQTQFKGIFMKNLKVLYDQVGKPAYQEFMLSSARSVWANSQNQTGQFGVKWSGPFDRSNASIQASAIDALNTQVKLMPSVNNLALGRPAWTTGSTCSVTEGATSAVDGSLDTKWCMGGGSGQSLTIDLGGTKAVSQFVVYHAGSNKENANLNANLNTKDFDIFTSLDNIHWAPQTQVRGNLSNITTHDIPAVIARYVRLYVITSQSSSAYQATRVNEVVVGGTDIPGTGLLLDQSAAAMNVGETMQLTASSASGIVWKSERDAVAIVDASGKVTGVSEGTAVITAKAGDGPTAACIVTVQNSTPPTGDAGGFYSGLEVSERQLTWSNNAELKQNVGGYAAGLTGMETKVVNYAGPTDTGFGNVLYYSGKATGPAGTDSYSYNRIFSVDIPMTESVTRLDYWIKPNENNGSYAGIDLAFSDGSYLHDKNGEFYRNQKLTVGQWNHVQVDLSAATGKTISRILVAYFRGTAAEEQAPGQFSGYLDDIRIGGAELPSVSPASDPNMSYVGRWDKSNPDRPIGYWGGTYFRAGFTGTSVKVVLPAKTKMYVSIDNGPDVLYDNAFGLVNLTTSPLVDGDHTLRIATSWMDQSLAVQGLILDRGAMTKKPPERTKIVEFIGDSITAGVVTNAVSDYAFLTGEKLNVDHTQVAFSGICLVECGRSTAPFGMSEQYFKQKPIFNAATPTPDWDFNQYTADAVVVNLGTNDNTEHVANDRFRDTYIQFLERIREKFPKAQILVMRSFGGFMASPTKEAVEARKTAGDNQVQYVDTTGWVNAGTSDFMDELHPSDAGHYKITQKLAPVIGAALALTTDPAPVSDGRIIWADQYSENHGDAYKIQDPSVGPAVATNSGGNWLKYSNIDFGNGDYDTLMANLAAWSTGNKIEIRLDSNTGQLLGILNTKATGGWDIYKEHYASISSVTGKHDVVLVFPSQYTANVNWFTFAKSPPAKETEAERAQRMQWFEDARFGQFIHWGAYSVLAGSYNGQSVGYAEWIMDNLHISKEDYRNNAAKRFNPNLFDAKKWVDLAKQAGQKYMVITSKHHEGYSMFDTEVGDFKPYGVVSMSPSHIDPMDSLSKEAKAQGIKFGFYYSIMDWMHPLSPPNGNSFNPADQAKKDKYISQMKGQLRELIEKYDPDILWFDGEWNAWWTKEDGKALYTYLRTLKNDLIINNRIGKRDADDGDFGTPEQEVPVNGLSYPWESCITINDTWGYSSKDVNWKSTSTLIRTLVETASKGGNLLLNIGPTSQGVTPQASVDRLHEMGAWLNIYGESIYGTKASVFADKLPWGYSTTKDGKVYLHVTNWPASGQLTVPQLTNTIRNVSLLQNPADVLDYKIVKNNMVINLPSKINGSKPNAIDEVIVLDVEGYPASGTHAAINLAAGKAASASDEYSSDYVAGKAVDGDGNSRWATKDGLTPYWLEVDLGESTTFNKIVVDEYGHRTGNYKIQYGDGTEWKDAYTGNGLNSGQEILFTPVTGTKVRLYITSLSVTDPHGPSIFEFKVYNDSESSVIPPVITLNGDAILNLVVGESFADPGATAKDASGADISSAIVSEGDVNTSVPGSYTVRYDVQDSDGIHALQAKRTVNVKPQAVTAIGGQEIVTVTDATYGATLKLYNPSNAVMAAKIATMNRVQFKSVPAGGMGYYVTQTISGMESAPSNKVDISPYVEPEPLVIKGGEGVVTVVNATYGATLELYDHADQFVMSMVAEASGIVEFQSVPPGADYYVIQTIDEIVGVPSNKVTVTGKDPTGPVDPGNPNPGNPNPGNPDPGTSGSGSSGSSGGSSSGSADGEEAVITTDLQGTSLNLPVPKVDQAGKASSVITDKKLGAALDAVKIGADGIKTLNVVIPEAKNADQYEVTIPAAFFMEKGTKQRLHVKTPQAVFDVMSDMFKPEELTGTKDVSIQWIITNRTVQLIVGKDGKVFDWSRPMSPLHVSIPYKPTSEQSPNLDLIGVSFTDQAGHTAFIPSGRYYAATGLLSFNAVHTGTFHISYEQKLFRDLAGYPWAMNPVQVMASKGIIQGTSSDQYSPGAWVTRADFIMMLVRGLDLTAETGTNFSDVHPGDYYYDAVATAKALGISEGAGGDQFLPRTAITRQEMMVFTVKALQAAKKQLDPATSAVLAQYADHDAIAGYAAESIALLVKNGIVQGDGKAIHPLGHTTRAEAAVIIYKAYMK
ncbi:carbohydrate-binding protein [Paenibacillus sp. HJL G12]|uniref:alpha-L-fucosidase n=1 Tax=Paenibacillus dendrobii TaxID=2691084 RepID=A0A7X3IK07_9BACL|nr:alpha-L-fucosidase [Paenibacillus dendrobii]MWV45354.1 carbohydrate-binding protein [Paenibacillus dendrobii]